ncbi:hypothetical protein H5200_12025 [Pseudoalteromonas sp. SG43-7]|uniref:hypothetical protein n=1 Tax=Pseudoalteromonas sp. SG43-7 TaxID=2760966 RepID=UPI0015FF7686|nr:hypothetical protein [Pseudoalteromonas sp. SG43-7]MBB1422647.1 hypothetical protein [Pseudoalteromonas sp. SG43-7]
MSDFLELTDQLRASVEQLNQVLQGDENTTVTINGEEKPSINKLIIDTLNSVVQLVTDAAADIDAVKYETTAAGIAATTNGQFFSVVSADDDAFLKLYKNNAGVAEFSKKYPNDKALDALYSTIVDEFFVNYVAAGDFIGGSPEMRSNSIGPPSAFVNLDNQQDLIERGYRKGIRWKLGNDFARAYTGIDINNKYIAGCVLIYSENPVNLPDAGNVILSEDGSGTLSVLTENIIGFMQLTPQLVLAYEYGRVDQVGAANILVGSSTAPTDNTRFATGFFATHKDIPFDIKALLSQVLIKDKLRLDSYKVSQSQGFSTPDDINNALTAYGSNGLPSALNNNFKKPFANEFVEGDFIAGVPQIRSGSKVADLAHITDFKTRGLSKGLNLRTTGNEFVLTHDIDELNGQYVLGAFYIHSEDEEFPVSSFVYSSTAGGSLKALSSPGYTLVPINDKFKLLLYKGQVNDNEAVNLVIGTTHQPVSPLLYTSGYYLITDKEEISFADAINNIFITDKCRQQIATNKIVEKPNLVLNGEDEDSYLIGYQGNNEIKRVVRPYPNADDFSQVKVFNFNGDYINEQVVKTGSDDVAPQRAMDTTIGANHGYSMGKYSANDHGKTDADIGSIYAIGAEKFVIVGINDSNSLWIAHQFNNSTNALISGVFNHLSGGADTSSFNGAYQSYSNLRPAFQNRKITVLADGKKVDIGNHNFKTNVKFIESYDVLSRDELISWFIEDRDANDFTPSGREASYTVSMVYEFDQYANCTIYSDIVFLKAINVQDLMFLQAMRQELDRYYIPKAAPFNQQSTDFDYAMIEPARKTSSNGLSSIYIDAAKMAENKIVDRYIGLNDDSATAFAMGYLPIKSASPDIRKPNTTDKAWEIRGNSDKMYPRVVDRENFVASVGECYSIIGYRNVFKRESGVTAKYPVKSSSGDYYYLDWHDISAAQRIELPNEYHGRELEIIEQLNVTLHTELVTDSISVSIDCVGSYAYLVFKTK